MTWTTAQVLALITDAKVAKNGQKLAVPSHWASLGRSETAIWGECQGSASTPYKTQIDLSGPAYRCNCPVRAMPCKHAAGLFLLLASQPGIFPQTAPPLWVADWLAKRAQPVITPKPSPEKTVDAAAKAKRAQKRETKVRRGMEAIDLWLRDLLRSGLASSASYSRDFWEAPAARMVDAQAPGIARMIRNMAAAATGQGSAPDTLFRYIARLHLLVSAYKRLDSLSSEQQADIRTMIGFTERQEDLLKNAGVRDRWLAVGQQFEDIEANLRARRTWLMGMTSGRAAMLLDFSVLRQPFSGHSYDAGACVETEMVFYPGTYPLRAVEKEHRGETTFPDRFPRAYPHIAAAFEASVHALTCNPWLDYFPMAIEGVIPLQANTGFGLRDGAGDFLPIAPDSSAGWRLMALSGGHPITVFGEWNNKHFWPFSAWAGDRLAVL